MSETNVFYDNDSIKVIARHLLVYGKLGVVSRWIHGDFYLVALNNGKSTVLKGAEMIHFKNEGKFNE